MLGTYFGSRGDILLNFVAVIQAVSVWYGFGWSSRNLFVIVGELLEDLSEKGIFKFSLDV